VRGESLLRTGKPLEAARAFETVAQDSPKGPHVAQALFGAARAHEAAGQADAARAARERLIEEFPETPWAKRAQTP
jgi:TolA-binding protein